MLCAFFGVIFVSVESGLAIAVGISLFKILLQVTRPKTVILGNIPGTDIFRNLHHYKESMRIPGFVIIRIESPINFANTTYLKERTLRWIDEYETEEGTKKQSSIHFLILDLSSVSSIDTSGVSFLVLVNPVGEVLEKLQRADNDRDMTRPGTLFLTVGEAVAALSSTI
uniref:STAS domain-containing protein n=1 Tax=Salix viminalis TaxID=40686 RepID=A0A6N2MZN1_SALVM